MPDGPWAFDPNAPAALTFRQQRDESARQLRAYLATLSPVERRRYMENRQGVLRGEVQQPAQEPAQQQPAQQQPVVMAPEVHIHQTRPDDRSPLERMGDNIEDAYRYENDSRVDQAREARRMSFAKDMEAMRQEGLLQRLQAMNDSPYQPAPENQGGPFGVFNPEAGRFDYYNRLRFD
ncbi:MAG: hypothetical protein EBR82_70065 [Caulobacteraceae bacterium]|nr:hypothetical protein [Caulobacteraceae bacterium]